MIHLLITAYSIELDIHNPNFSIFIQHPKFTVSEYLVVIFSEVMPSGISEMISSLVLYLNQPQDNERPCSRLHFIAR
jgi:hypothetical protein